MSQPYSLHNALRIYDHMVAEWVNGCPVDYGNLAGYSQPQRGMLWVFASPHKAIAEMAKLLLRKKWTLPGVEGTGNLEPGQWIRLPTPFASIARQRPVPDPSRANVPFRYRKFLPTTFGTRPTRFPRPIDIEYQIDYRMRRVYTQNYIDEWVAAQVAPIGASPNEFYMRANFGSYWGTKLIPVQNIQIADNSDLEPGEDENRALRTTLTFTVKGWFFFPLEAEVKTVFRILVDVIPTDINRDGTVNTDTTEDPEWTEVYQDYDVVEEMINLDEVFIELGDGATEVSTNVYSIPPTSFIQTMPVPVFGEEAARVDLDLETDVALDDGVKIEVFDYNDNPLGVYHVGCGETEFTPRLWLHLDGFVNAFRFRFIPTETAQLTLNDIEVWNGTYQLSEQTNQFSAGDMESGDATDWEPDAESDLDAPVSVEFTDEKALLGSQSLKAVFNAAGQGIERNITLDPREVYLVRCHLTGVGDVVDLSVLDDEYGSHTTENSITLQPASNRWDEVALVVQPRSGTIALRARQRKNSNTTLYMDSVTIVKVRARWQLSEAPLAV